jgi:hypothetical protein
MGKCGLDSWPGRQVPRTCEGSTESGMAKSPRQRAHQGKVSDVLTHATGYLAGIPLVWII